MDYLSLLRQGWKEWYELGFSVLLTLGCDATLQVSMDRVPKGELLNKSRYYKIKILSFSFTSTIQKSLRDKGRSLM